MQKVVRWTRTGRVREATAAIQRALRGGGPATTAKQPAPDVVDDVIDAEVRVVSVDDVKVEAPTRPAAPAVETPDRAPDVATGQFIAGAFANTEGRREYKLYIPSGTHTQPMPLVVMLHGCKQNPDDFAAGTRMNHHAESERVFVLYPAQTKKANGLGCWNWFHGGNQERDRGEPSIIAGMTREIIASYPIDPKRVYVAGLSAGGAMAAIMGYTYPELYAAVGVHSGLAHGAAHDVMSAFAAMRQGPAAVRAAQGKADDKPLVPTIVFHGDKDATVHPSNGDHVIAQAKPAAPVEELIDGVPPDAVFTVERGQVRGGRAYTRTIHRAADGRSTGIEHWVVHGSGHAWSGGSPKGSYTDPHGPDASREMLRFFADHPMP